MSEIVFLKKSFFNIYKLDLIFLLSNKHSFYYLKIDLIFYKCKNHFFFFSSSKKDLMFFKLKDFILDNKKNLNFYHQKPLFFTSHKTNLIFWQIKIIILIIKTDLNFFLKKKSKEVTSLINKFVWFNFSFTCSTHHSWHA